MERIDIKTGKTIITSAPFRTNKQVVLETTDLDEFYEISKLKILESLSLYLQAGSGWRFVSVEKMDINIIEYNPMRVKSYIPLDKNLATKKAIINIKNEDDQLSLNQITQFEKNYQDISVNVYGYENSEVRILHDSKNNNCKHLIDLLLISNEESLSNHKSYCETRDSVRIELPLPNSTMQFTNHNKSIRVPFVVYADVESFIKHIETCETNPNESYTKQYQKHIPSKLVVFTASSKTDDVAQIFVYSLQKNIKKIYGIIKFPKKMTFTTINKHDFNAAISCHICGKKLNEDKVRDHCHITGKYIGAAHQNCNLNYKVPKFFPVLFHNLSGYDSHLFIKKLSGGKLSCIPNNEENLDALSKNLAKDQCKNIGKLYSGKKLDLLLIKGVYPNDSVDSFKRFNVTQLPTKESFFSKLNDENINDDGYSHAQNVWNEFNCKKFRDYHDLYNISDVLLLDDVSENFRDVCMKCYKLDPAWYYTSS
ncbi:uncharacterized protein LOC136074013 [Hydra vulgaris]|uniref:Uncharacterized protein LOC136074013 n=1 Tax=Hydra vulgaris TaxID=6087 RepID=A0ABM4B0W2_HYDVU